MLGPFATASRYIAIHQVSLLSHAATVSCRLHNDDNDNEWQRGPLWPHRMGPTKCIFTNTIVAYCRWWWKTVDRRDLVSFASAAQTKPQRRWRTWTTVSSLASRCTWHWHSAKRTVRLTWQTSTCSDTTTHTCRYRDYHVGTAGQWVSRSVLRTTPFSTFPVICWGLWEFRFFWP